MHSDAVYQVFAVVETGSARRFSGSRPSQGGGESKLGEWPGWGPRRSGHSSPGADSWNAGPERAQPSTSPVSSHQFNSGSAWLSALITPLSTPTSSALVFF